MSSVKQLIREIDGLHAEILKASDEMCAYSRHYPVLAAERGSRLRKLINKKIAKHRKLVSLLNVK